MGINGGKWGIINRAGREMQKQLPRWEENGGKWDEIPIFHSFMFPIFPEAEHLPSVPCLQVPTGTMGETQRIRLGLRGNGTGLRTRATERSRRTPVARPPPTHTDLRVGLAPRPQRILQLQRAGDRPRRRPRPPHRQRGVPGARDHEAAGLGHAVVEGDHEVRQAGLRGRHVGEVEAVQVHVQHRGRDGLQPKAQVLHLRLRRRRQLEGGAVGGAGADPRRARVPPVRGDRRRVAAEGARQGGGAAREGVVFHHVLERLSGGAEGTGGGTLQREIRRRAGPSGNGKWGRTTTRLPVRHCHHRPQHPLQAQHRRGGGGVCARRGCCSWGLNWSGVDPPLSSSRACLTTFIAISVP